MGKRRQRRARRYDPTRAVRPQLAFRRIPQPRIELNPERAWFVVRSSIRSEKRAAFGLERAGFDVFVPMVIEERAVRGKLREMQRPLLVRYLFVGLPIEAHRRRFDLVREVDGVEDVLAISGAPRAVQAIVLQRLADECCEVPPPDVPFKPGDLVRIVEGPFRTFEAYVDGVMPDGRVRVLASLLGRQTPMDVEAAELEAA
jgi:transcription antitermination factor NusG